MSHRCTCTYMYTFPLFISDNNSNYTTKTKRQSEMEMYHFDIFFLIGSLILKTKTKNVSDRFSYNYSVRSCQIPCCCFPCNRLASFGRTYILGADWWDLADFSIILVTLTNKQEQNKNVKLIFEIVDTFFVFVHDWTLLNLSHLSFSNN